MKKYIKPETLAIRMENLCDLTVGSTQGNGIQYSKKNTVGSNTPDPNTVGKGSDSWGGSNLW